MKTRWRRGAFLAPLIAVALAASACGGGSGDDKKAAPPPKADQNQINPTDRDKVQDGGKLTWPLGQIPANFNYHHIDGTESTVHDVMWSMMPLMHIADAAGSPQWNKDYLAAEPKVTTDPKQVITYEINSKAQWDDGTPMTWEDFHWQWKATNGTDKAYVNSSSNGYSDIESVEKGQDDRQVVVTFKNRFADWQSLFSPLYPASTNKDPKVFNEGWKAEPLAATAGPFKFGSIDKTAQTITVVRNDKWWGNPAKLDEIVFRVIEPNAQIDALANGEVDFVDIGPNADHYQRAVKFDGVEIRQAGGPNFRHFTINATSKVLEDVKVRQAIAQGIDRAAIAKAMLGPLGLDPKPLDNHIFMANQDGYKNNSGDVGTYNPDKAKAGLDAAGWTLNGDVREKDGTKLEINFVIPAGVASSKQEAELTQNMLGQIGVKVNINAVPINDFFEKYVTPGNFDFTVFSWLGTPFPISSSKSIYAEPKKNDKGELEFQQNYARVGSAALDKLFDDANAELDRSKAIDLANQADAMIWESVHSLTLYQRPELIAAKKELANHGAKGFADFRYEDIGWVK
ncbi:MAG TPA: ABC transporter family substrate-binding protein [Micromonosporaceae bacterium]|nr:ABC transporter family substrate-binding protein [Micromonosporaceae bacterium]